MRNSEEYFSISNLKLAFFRVRCWTEKISKDQVGLRAFESSLEENCRVLSEKLNSGTWTPSRGFKFYIPKSSGTQRTKTLLFVEDAIVYQAIANLIAKDNYALFSDNDDFVYGSVLSPEVSKGEEIMTEENPNYFFFRHWKFLYVKFIDSVKTSIETDDSRFRFETDITGFFDSIPHYCLLSMLSEKFMVDDTILDLLSDCFNVWSGTKDSMTPGVGIPQGPVPSYFFANLLLHELDDLIISYGFKYYRYMDDIKIYWYNKEELQRALVLIDNYLKGKGLSINSKKTSIEELTGDLKANSVKELERKMFSIGPSSAEDGDFSESNADTKNVAGQFSDFFDQDVDDYDFSFGSELIVDKDKIIEVWSTEVREVEKTIKSFFVNPESNFEQLEIKEDVLDTDFINCSFRYFAASKALKELEAPLIPSVDFLKYWLAPYLKYYWRVSSFGLTLSLYGKNDLIKNVLEKIALETSPLFEWVQYHAIMQLSIGQEFTDKELREVYFRKLTIEPSQLVRLALYRLLFRHGQTTLITALKKQLQKEGESYLKIQVADFNKRFGGDEIDIVEFIEFIGI
jgi:retron-type reverse transcriptase